MKHHVQRVIDHLWGPTGSVILHLVVIIAAVKFFTIATADKAPEVDVKMMEIETIKLDKLKELEKKPDDPKVDRVKVDVEVPSDVPEPEKLSDFAQEDPTVNLNALDVMSSLNRPLVMQNLFKGRTKGVRDTVLRDNGGSEETEKSVIAALRWLKEHQQADGSWQKSPVPMTGLALLTFLAHGETPSSEEFGETVEKAIKYLIAQQGPGGHIGPDRRPVAYQHAIATYALAEAYAMCRIPAIMPVVEQAVAVIVNGQQAGGGWDYGYAKGPRRDTSVSGWNIQALKAAYLAGTEVSGVEAALKRSIRDLRSVYNPDQGSFGYTTAGGDNWRMTGIGTLCMQLLGYGESTEARGGIRNLADLTCVWDPTGNLYGWYYVTQAKFHAGGGTWDAWNRQFATTLTAAQNPDGHWDGPAEEHGTKQQGPVYDTTLCALMLQVYYRNLPTFSEDAVKVRNYEAEAAADDVQVIEIL